MKKGIVWVALLVLIVVMGAYAGESCCSKKGASTNRCAKCECAAKCRCKDGKKCSDACKCDRDCAKTCNDCKCTGCKCKKGGE